MYFKKIREGRGREGDHDSGLLSFIGLERRGHRCRKKERIYHVVLLLKEKTSTLSRFGGLIIF